MPKPLSEVLAPRPESRLRVYAYSIEAPSHVGLLKIGQTARSVKQRVQEQTKTVGIQAKIELDRPADRDDGGFFTDHLVRARLNAKGFRSIEPAAGAGEWVECSVADIETVITELRTGARLTGSHHETFAMRDEQRAAVQRTHQYFHSIWSEDMNAVPRFLWNAKMRFGKTFAAYQLARKLGATRILVVTFKPAVEDAWQTDLESHVDFDGWQYLSRSSGADPTQIDPKKPVVYFGSFQDLLGKDAATGAVKAKNAWLHTINWDLVIFDEYHFGAWRDTAKELFEGEAEPVFKAALKQEDRLFSQSSVSGAAHLAPPS